MDQSITIIIPVRNAAAYAARQVEALRRQTITHDVLIIDSESIDGSPDIYRAAGFAVHTIPIREFDHGGTRNLGVSLTDSDIIVFLTQDAILAHDEAIEKLCEPFANPDVGISYGRQLPRSVAGPIERHARLFNYPPTSELRGIGQHHSGGIRSIYNSNSFAAYRRRMLESMGGFVQPTIMSEEVVAAGRAFLAGWMISYTAAAMVEHSHGYTLMQEFRRYFDQGVAHGSFPDIYRRFKSNGEGTRFVKSELAFLTKRAPHRIPEAVIRTALKLTAYHLGVRQLYIPVTVKRRLAMHPSFFNTR